MLLAHQVGSVKIGEVVRYTVTYTPSSDRILPSPECLYLRVRNTCNVALRAAFVHGPYTLSVAAFPAHFDPNQRFENPRRYGVPEFEPMLKAGGSWSCPLVVPDNIRQTAGTGNGYFGGGPEQEGQSCSWIIEVAAQVLFSTSAVVHYEILLARDEKSVNLGSAVPVLGASQAQPPQPGRVSDFQPAALPGSSPRNPKGVFSRAVHLEVEDTAALWSKPRLPGWDEVGWRRAKDAGQQLAPDVSDVPLQNAPEPKKQKKVHLVILTHGLHSNLGADMLFMKESIDAGVRQAKVDARKRKAKERAARKEHDATPSDTPEAETTNEDAEDDDDEEVTIVRGFSGNATKTEKGVKYLGKRLARYILSMTYPDQPFLPTAKAASEAINHTLKSAPAKHSGPGAATHKHSSIHVGPPPGGNRLYKITKISFIAHSLGGLVQTYAVAYIQKHSPKFFDLIEPVNFIALATPFLGLNHENPLYVGFALDFGLVGRTGQDLGLTWRAPTIARSGWGAIVSNLGENAHKHVYGETQPESKPLLRILPTGPAHTALKKFRNRTVYSNVVNDGIVPLRTSCLLFLDWQGLGRVEKARREAGLVETVVGFGWAELTGANVTSSRTGPWTPIESQDESDTGANTPKDERSHQVPLPSTNATLEDDQEAMRPVSHEPLPKPDNRPEADPQSVVYSSNTNNTNPFTGIFNFFRHNDTPKSPPPPQTSNKQKKILQRSQTLRFDDSSGSSSAEPANAKSRVTSGEGAVEDGEGVLAPPRTSFFESAGDLLNPKLPSVEYLIDPAKRPRTIFHDRIYHPSDIPPPPLKKRPTGTLALRRKSQTQTPTAASTSASSRTPSGSSSPYMSPRIQHVDTSFSQRDYDDTAHTKPDKDPSEVIDSSQMKVEEKIARAYHNGLSWRKVLVKLEPDAHNNIIVRRSFANAFGWPVVHHLVESHFSDSVAARTRDEDESNKERAKALEKPPDKHGKETKAPEGSGNSSSDDVVSDDKNATDQNVTEDKDAPAPSPLQEHLVEEHERTKSETREARDAVPELPKTPRHGDPEDEKRGRAAPASASFPSSPGSPTLLTAARPPVHRLDSVTWSDRDWADSGDESDSYGGESRQPSMDVRKDESGTRGAPAPASASASATVPSPGLLGLGLTAGPASLGGGGAWDWAEKIVGKGAMSRSRSPADGGP